ncbi:hypothetical protein ACHAWF_008762 [Thalassiosira exigua]
MSPPNRDDGATIALGDGPSPRHFKRVVVEGSGAGTTTATASTAAAAAVPRVVSSSSSIASSPSDDDGGGDGGALLLPECLSLLFPPLPPSLRASAPGGSGGDAASLRSLFLAHGFRATTVTLPRPAASVYLDSCATPASPVSEDRRGGRDLLSACLGTHPRQASLEGRYAGGVREVYCLALFLRRMRGVREEDMADARVADVAASWERKVAKVASATAAGGRDRETSAELRDLAASAPAILSRLLSTLAEIDHTLRSDQLRHEYDRIACENCTLSNACLRRWLGTDDAHDVDKVFFKPSPPGRYLPKYERVTLELRDPNSEEPRGGNLVLLPSLTRVLNRSVGAGVHPLDPIVDDMIETTWESLFSNGYYVDPARKERLGPELRTFYRSGLLGGRDPSVPVLLNAHFDPTHPLSLYLRGTAGAGKSSLVRALLPALSAAISAHCDPEILVRFVKQNLNKPSATLKLELDLRPNNNDRSVMSIVQGRRMTLTQSKPGLVLVALEEMPSNVEGADPKQADVCRLISMRFSGRKGDFREGEKAPRNSAKRGISGDATIITIFTSNYDIEDSGLDALRRLDMFKNLAVIDVAPVAGEDRVAFASIYLMRQVEEGFAAAPSQGSGKVDIKRLDIPFGKGDARPLVRYLRMLSFYIRALIIESGDALSSTDISIMFDPSTSITTITADNGGKMQLKPGSFGNLYSVTQRALDPRASNTVAELQKMHPNMQNPTELSTILDFWFANTLAPAVVLSRNRKLMKDLIGIVSNADGVDGIGGVDVASYKIMKSLYDDRDTPNLRDDILQLLHNGGTYVAVELLCWTADAQLQIREIVEDTPSMTAFSTERSALRKEGLLFMVFVEGDISPEIESRASLVI